MAEQKALHRETLSFVVEVTKRLKTLNVTDDDEFTKQSAELIPLLKGVKDNKKLSKTLLEFVHSHADNELCEALSQWRKFVCAVYRMKHNPGTVFSVAVTYRRTDEEKCIGVFSNRLKAQKVAKEYECDMMTVTITESPMDFVLDDGLKYA